MRTAGSCHGSRSAAAEAMQDLSSAGHGTCVLQVPEVAELDHAVSADFDDDRSSGLSVAWLWSATRADMLFRRRSGMVHVEVVSSVGPYTGRRIAVSGIGSHAGQGGACPSAVRGSGYRRRVWQREWFAIGSSGARGYYEAAAACIAGKPVTPAVRSGCAGGFAVEHCQVAGARGLRSSRPRRSRLVRAVPGAMVSGRIVRRRPDPGDAPGPLDG